MNFGDDDIVIMSDGKMYFGDVALSHLIGSIVEIIEPEDEHYWEYFFDIEE